MTRQHATRCLPHATALALCLVAVRGGRPGGDGRDSQLTPPVMLAGLDENVSVRGVSTDVETSFGELFERLDVGATLSFEARCERCGTTMGWTLSSGWTRSSASPSAGAGAAVAPTHK